VREATARILDSTSLADIQKRAEIASRGREALEYSI
jgi:hypothetical protein